jgi:hypothetical protein
VSDRKKRDRNGTTFRFKIVPELPGRRCRIVEHQRVDSLLRSENARPDSDKDSASLRAEVGRIFANGLRQRGLPSADKSYLTQIVAARAGLSPADAGMRVSSVFVTVQETAENARKALAHSLLWIFVALLFGAFCASFAATIGGGQRDHVVVV